MKSGRSNALLTYSDQNEKPILGKNQLFSFIAIRAHEQSLISLLFPRMPRSCGWCIQQRIVV